MSDKSAHEAAGRLGSFSAALRYCELLGELQRLSVVDTYQVPFFNGGLRTPFAPEHAFKGADGNLHLMANNDIDLGAGKVWSGAEAVLMFNSDGSEANLGYGDYLVTAKLVDHVWADLDPNMAFGLFTYETPVQDPIATPTARWIWRSCHVGVGTTQAIVR